MQRFQEPHDPLAERVSDVELRQVLERLGEAQFGGDERATVGAVVEATGADAATVLRILGEVRMEAIKAQRVAMEAMDRRVSRLETHRSASSFEARSRVHETEVSEAAKGGRTLLVILAFATVLLVFLLGMARMSARPTHNGFDPSISISAGDGWMSPDANGRLRVREKDGTVRDATPMEDATFTSLAGAMKNGR